MSAADIDQEFLTDSAFSLRDKVILITGASGGMGRTHVDVCTQLGAQVVMVDVSEPAAGAHTHEDRTTFIRASVSSADDWHEVARTVEGKFGRLDGVVNNAGILLTQTLEETAPEDFDRIIEVNQRGVYLGMRATLPLLKRAGSGSIVNVSSTAGLVGIAGCFAYSASKFAVRGMTKAAAIELASWRIRVNSIHPGDTLTPMIAGLENTSAVPDTSTIPLSRFAEPMEISRAVAFLLSNAAAYITGAELVVDGGYTAA